jgi:hypothetical protein
MMNQRPTNHKPQPNNSMSSPSFYPVSMADSRLSEIDSNVHDGIAAVVKTTQQRESCAWTYLRDNPPSERTGYMFSDNPMFTVINSHMQVSHSGSSYAWTMRNLQFIATHGLDAYIAECRPRN